MAEPISVMICDDLEPLRMILRKTIERHEGFSVISEASTTALKNFTSFARR